MEDYHKKNQKLLKEEENEVKQMEEESKNKNRMYQFIDGNLMLSTERRLTTVNEQEMTSENIKRLKESYRHPFDRIPKNYFDTRK